MDKQPIIELKAVVGANPQKLVSKPIDFVLNQGEHIALLGDNGSGKSLISELICSWGAIRAGEAIYNMDNSRPLHENIKALTFRSEYDSPDFYFQQRWNSSEYDDCPTVGEQLAQIDFDAKIASLIKIDSLMSRQVVQLSSGELRRLSIFKALVSSPKVLIIDNLFVGLDRAMRKELNSAIEEIAAESGVSLITLSARERDIPQCTTHIYHVSNMSLSAKEPFVAPKVVEESISAAKVDIVPASFQGESIVDFESVNIRFGERVLFQNFQWKINQGEKWLLTGGNGSGKTTLLSLISGDNPQAYAQKISLFGRKRGSGESIWDIKKRIGFLSPEMLRGYIVNVPSENIVASGFFDTVGLYQKPNSEQLQRSLESMESFGIAHLAGRSFIKLSSGEQRMVLLARAFVKNPDLLILDEPFHETDARYGAIVAKKITEFSQNPQKSIIYVSHYTDEIPLLTTHRLVLSRDVCIKGTSKGNL